MISPRIGERLSSGLKGPDPMVAKLPPLMINKISRTPSAGNEETIFEQISVGRARYDMFVRALAQPVAHTPSSAWPRPRTRWQRPSTQKIQPRTLRAARLYY